MGAQANLVFILGWRTTKALRECPAEVWCSGKTHERGDFNQGHFPGYQLDKPGEHYALCSRPANSDAHMSNLLLLMAQRMGVETDKFGDSNKVIEL